MAESEQAVVSIFGVEMVVGPMAVKAAFGGPKRVDEIQAAFVQATGDAPFKTGQRMQRGRGGKKIGNRRAWHSEKAALRRGLRENPIADRRVHWKTEMRDERNRASGGVEIADFLPRLIAPGVIGSFKAFEAAN